MTTPISRRIRRIAIVTFATALFAAASGRAVEFGVRAGGYLDEHDPFVGLELFVPLGSGAWAFDPNVEAAFGDATDRLSFNADFRFNFLADSRYAVFGGFGPAFIHLDRKRGRDDEDDFGVNLFGGADWRLDGFTPYAQIKVVASDESEVVAAVGVRF
ncbi:MAG: hypothetical protein KDB94_05135 [Acidobacteria bacterium]|nr:hypothetical protein [Acidobacteriota bacterium]